MKRQLLQPPEIINVEGLVVFLAGPIQDAPDWQSVAARNIHDLDEDIIVASPRKIYLPGEFVYERQVDWESYYLDRAAKFGTVMFWLANQEKATIEKGQRFPRPYAQTTRQELGEWRTKKQYNPEINLVVGIDSKFTNDRYIRRRIEQDTPDVPILTSLGATCAAAVELARSGSGGRGGISLP